MHTFVCTLQALWVMIERFCLLTAFACLLLMDRVQVQLSAPPPFSCVYFLTLLSGLPFIRRIYS